MARAGIEHCKFIPGGSKHICFDLTTSQIAMTTALVMTSCWSDTFNVVVFLPSCECALWPHEHANYRHSFMPWKREWKAWCFPLFRANKCKVKHVELNEITTKLKQESWYFNTNRNHNIAIHLIEQTSMVGQQLAATVKSYVCKGWTWFCDPLVHVDRHIFSEKDFITKLEPVGPKSCYAGVPLIPTPVI